MENLKRRLSALAGWLRRSLLDNLTLVLTLLVALTLAQFEPAYNHMVGAYALVGLLVLNLRHWQGRASAGDLVLPVSFLAPSLWILWQRNADVIPYLGILYFAAAAVACGIDLARRRPRKFRDEARVAENYLDTGLRALLAVTGVLMGLAWMPDPRYIAVPFGMLLAFRLALPLRRLAYPLLLRAVGLAPTAGALPQVADARVGYTLPRAVLLAVSLLLAALIGPQLVFTHARYDLTIPTLHMLPRELVLERQAELDVYVATLAGGQDAAALTELGLLLHERGLIERAYLARARAVLQRAMALDPGSAQAVAWYGSTLAAEALHEQQPVRRTRLVSEGLGYLDRAVAQAPDDPVVRLARASVCLGLPRFIGRAPTARADVDHLLELARTHPRESDPILPLVYQLAGDVYTLVGEPEQARRAFEAALGEWPEPSTDYRLIRARLAALGGPHAQRQLADGPRAAEARP